MAENFMMRLLDATLWNLIGINLLSLQMLAGELCWVHASHHPFIRWGNMAYST